MSLCHFSSILIQKGNICSDKPIKFVTFLSLNVTFPPSSIPETVKAPNNICNAGGGGEI